MIMYTTLSVIPLVFLCDIAQLPKLPLFHNYNKLGSTYIIDLTPSPPSIRMNVYVPSIQA